MKSGHSEHPSSVAIPVTVDHSVRTGLGEEAIAAAVADNLHYQQAIPSQFASRHDWYMALALAVRDRLLDRYLKGIDALLQSHPKVVAYFSAEFLTGPHLGNHLINLGIWDAAAGALSRFGQNLADVLEEEEEPGLGNGGLGRLAACYMDSLATLGVPAIGYGIRYEFGIFDQAIRDGWQVETTDKWLRLGNPWEVPRPERDAYDVGFGGRTEHFVDEDGRPRVRWIPEKGVKGVAYDTPVSGYRLSDRQPDAAVEGRGDRVVRFRCLQRRRLLPRGAPERGLGNHHEGAVSERRARGRQGASARAAVLLRVLLAAGHDPPAR